MPMEIWKEGDRYRVRIDINVRLANVESAEWMPRNDLIAGLFALGFHQQDVGDALNEADLNGHAYFRGFSPLRGLESDQRNAVIKALDIMGYAIGCRW